MNLPYRRISLVNFLSIMLISILFLSCSKEENEDENNPTANFQLSKIIKHEGADEYEETTYSYNDNNLIRSIYTLHYEGGLLMHEEGYEYEYGDQGQLIMSEYLAYNKKDSRITYEWYEDSCVLIHQQYGYGSQELGEPGAKTVVQLNDEGKAISQSYYYLFDEEVFNERRTYEWTSGNLTEIQVYDHANEPKERIVYFHDTYANSEVTDPYRMYLGFNTNNFIREIEYDEDNIQDQSTERVFEYNDDNLPSRVDLKIDGILVEGIYYTYEYVELR